MDEKEFFEQLKKNNLPVVVDFWAPWCGPCKTIEPVVKKLSQDYAGRVDVWKVNVDESPELRSKLKILGIPTLIVYRGGQEATRCTGAASITILNMLFETATSGAAPAHPFFTLHERFVHLVLDFSKTISSFKKWISKGTIGVKLSGG